MASTTVAGTAAAADPPAPNADVASQEPANRPIAGYSAAGKPIAQVAGTNGTVMAVATPYVTRSTILRRARTWYAAEVPYSQAVKRGGYRTDCSGYVSMTWGLGYFLNTVSLGQSSITHRISKNELKPGDILLNTTGTNLQRHVVLFERWANAAHTKYLVYEQSGPRYSPTKHHVITYPYPSHPELYVPRRYNRIRERADVNRDGFGDVIARSSSGNLYRHLSRPGRNSFSTRTQIGTGFGSYSQLIGTDLNRDGYQDLLAKDRSGRLYRFLHRPGHKSYGSRVLLSKGWNAYSTVVSADLNNDGYSDLVARNRNGRLYRYLNRPGHNAFARRSPVSDGWNAYSAVISADLNADGYTDLLARNKNGRIYRYLNRPGHNAFAHRSPVSDGWDHYSHLVASDLNGDGYQDLLTKSRTSGRLYLHLNNPGRNSFVGRVRVAGSWSSYNSLV